MIKTTSLCTSCVQPITNPLCPFCFVREVLVWLDEEFISKKTLLKIKKEFQKILLEVEDTPSDISCVVCGAPKVNYCTYCFTNKAERVLERNIGEGELLENFRDLFNTGIWIRPDLE